MFFRDDPAKNARRRESWTRVRERGRFRYVLTRGVFGVGGVIFLFVLGNSLIRKEAVNAGILLFTAVGAFPIGAIWGLALWKGKEERYGSDTGKNKKG